MSNYNNQSRTVVHQSANSYKKGAIQSESNDVFSTQDNLRELQRLEFDLLRKIDAICTRNNLQYFLAEGTLLGAIRHGGFIPWDDDVDVCMPREDFNRFIAIASSELPDGYICDNQNDTGIWGTLRISDTNHRIIRTLHGKDLHLFVSVDVFPLDGFPKSKLSQKVHWLGIFFRYCVFRSTKIEQIDKEKKRGFLLQLAIKLATLIPFGKLFNEQKALRSLTEALEKYSFSDSDMTIHFYSEYGKKSFAVPKTVMPKSFFGDGRFATFESEKLSIPSEAEKILEREYGDYMTLPPVQERTAKHRIKLIM